MLDKLSPETRDVVDALLILAAFWVPALLLRLLWSQILSPWIKRSSHASIAFLLRPIRSLVIWALILSGLNFAIQSLDAVDRNSVFSNSTEKSLAIAWVLLAAIMTNRFIIGWFKYQARRAVTNEEEVKDRVSTPQKLTTALVIVLGALFVMRIAGVDISPLLAGGAVGGIIIGLALQDSLSNVFAGLFINIDRPIRVGDLLRLDQDREGFVEEVGWRYTKVRLWNDSMLIIPNNKFGQSSFVNFNRPVADLNVNVVCGVSYSSDLDHVEKIAIEAAKAAMEKINDKELAFEPYIRWFAFGDYSMQFRINVRTDHATKQYRLISETIRQVHKRFREEGIDIPIPERTVHMISETRSGIDGTSP